MVNVLVAGIGGASLGTEIAKSLRLAEGYCLFGADISPLAYGHYAGLFDETVLVERQNYTDQILDFCVRRQVEVVIPGGDQPTALIATDAAKFETSGIHLALNNPRVVGDMADKARCFEILSGHGFSVPETHVVTDAASLSSVAFPCILKPANDSGGSAYVFYARDAGEALLYATYIRKAGRLPLAQGYIPHDRGEFTVGVLSGPDKTIYGSIALKRAFPAKLSVAASGNDFLISSGFSQGHIGAYPEVCSQAAEIAWAVGSTGPFNVQGRLDESGQLIPFEINPRFSASTYLRALAGFNEIDAFIRLLLRRSLPDLTIRSGWYLRSLTETVVADNEVVS